MTTKGYKEKIQLMQQHIDKQEEQIIYLNNELSLCKETNKVKEPQKEYPKNLTKGNSTTTTPMVKFQTSDVASILEGRIKAMKMYTRKKR